MILDEYVNGWSVDLAKRMLTDAIIKNDYKIDAVFAHNDIFAGAAAVVPLLPLPKALVAEVSR